MWHSTGGIQAGHVRMSDMQLATPDIRQALIVAYASVLDSLGLARHARPLVLPNGEFFPDIFKADEASVQRLLDRLLEHAGLSDMAVVVKFWNEGHEPSCGTGACGSGGPAAEEPTLERLVDDGDAWRVNVLPAEARQPVALSSALCRALALAVLREADAPPRQLNLDLAVDLTAVALGFGLLLLEGSHIYRKACSGPSVSKSTALGPNELAWVLALDLAASGQSARALPKYLSPTQREAFAEARVWADTNIASARMLRTEPRRLARGVLELREPASRLSRWFAGSRRKPSAADAGSIDELEAALANAVTPRVPAKPRAPDPKLDEIKRLVEEALSD